MADQYYRFFPGDYQRDTGDLTLVEHGAYRVLLDHYYTRGPLPNDLDRLYRLCRAFSTEEQTAVSTVVERYFQPNGNRLRNRKADKELSDRDAFIEMQREKGRKSAEIRAERKKEQEDDSTVVITDVPTTAQPGFQPGFQPNVNLPSPSPSPSPSPLPTNKHESINTLSSFSGENPPSKNGNCPHEDIVALYHEVLPMMPRVNIWPESNRKILRTRWKEEPERQDLAWWRSYFEYIRESQFLTGKEKDWTANLEWIVRPKNMTKILNGAYHKQKYGGIREWLNQTESNSQP